MQWREEMRLDCSEDEGEMMRSLAHWPVAPIMQGPDWLGEGPRTDQIRMRPGFATMIDCNGRRSHLILIKIAVTDKATHRLRNKISGPRVYQCLGSG